MPLRVIKENVIYPLVGRIGTAVAASLIPYGIHATQAEQIGVGVAAAALVAFDLATSYVLRQKAKYDKKE